MSSAARSLTEAGLLAVQVTDSGTSVQSTVLTEDALAFVVQLERLFGERRRQLLVARQERQSARDRGELPHFLPETAWLRQSDWHVRIAPSDLQDRRVEITGPVDRKMIINALNSGAKVFMADFEDAHSPVWSETLEGQEALAQAVGGILRFTSEEGKVYELGPKPATLIVRPRGWHLEEKHVLVDGERISASLFDFGLYVFRNAKALLEKGSGPYFYLPKMESHLEARLWNDVFVHAEGALGIPRGSICCTVLIETLPAAFEMDEILYELRDYIVGLNCGRWDYIFSYIKTFQNDPERVLPDRASVSMTVSFLRAYSKLLIKTCHRRGAHAMGGMAAQIPIKSDPTADAEAKVKVRADKEREAGDGHDGTWVAHPGLVPVAMEVFDRIMPQSNQIDRKLADVNVSAADLLAIPSGEITESGIQNNISAALHYLAAWFGGRGAVPIHNLMEDAATAEIARSQLWQWIRYPKGVLADGRRITGEMFHQVLARELETALSGVDDSRVEKCYRDAAKLLDQVVTDDAFQSFITLPAYEKLD